LRELADEYGALLLVDEVQTGVGRTGRFLGCQREGIVPDAVALAKALGGGFPIGALLCRDTLLEALPPGSHGTTFGGNALASAAALAVLEVIEAEGLLDRVESLGAHLARELEGLARRHPDSIATTRGVGLLQAVVLSDTVNPGQVLAAVRDAGVLLTLAGGNALRFSPPLTVTREQLDTGVRVIDSVLAGLAAGD
jgi:acetylornithine/N-succinyldiaminopimelate aminotransferase